VGVWAETRNGVQRAYAQNITPNGSTGVSTAGFAFSSPAAAVVACPAPASMSIQLSTIASGSFSGAISLAASGVPTGTSLSFSSNPVNVGSSTTVTLTGTDTLAPVNYTITVAGTAAGESSQNVTLTFTITAPPAIAITSQPAAQVVCAGTTITYSVVATGSSLTYQWQQSFNGCNGPWQDITGATAATLSLGAALVAQNNTGYRCVVAAPCATSLTSNCGLLTVGTSLTITKKELEEMPEDVLRILAEIYERRRLKKETAAIVAKELTEVDALGAHARDELGITELTQANPIQAALASGAAITAGGFLPLLVALLVPLHQMEIALYGVTILALTFLGADAARTGGSSIKRGILRVVVWGTIAMGLSALVGFLFGVRVLNFVLNSDYQLVI
jgi:hypothetical protein